MSSLSSKTAEEVCELLDEYGIKHGPVVDSTRKLYEKKLKEVMGKGQRAKQKAAPDKTYYREEEDEVTYVYRTPVRSDVSGDYTERGSYMSANSQWAERELESEKSYSTYLRSRPEYKQGDFVDRPSSYTNSSLKSKPMEYDAGAPKTPKSSRLIPLWLQFVFFLAVAVFLYFVFSSMEANESIKGIQ